MKRSLYFLLTFIFASINNIYASEKDIHINEVMPANVSFMLDATYNYNGWIELYNSGTTSVNLSGFSVTDDYNQPQKFTFPKNIGSIGAGEYKIIFFGNNDLDPNNVNFKLDCDGASIYLFSKTQTLLSSVEYGYAYPETSYARKKDGGETWATCSSPTPGKSNNDSEFSTKRAKKPETNIAPGIYSGNLIIKLEGDKGSIRYTPDGSEPTLHSKVWNKDMIINSTTVIRARAFKQGQIPSEILTCTYIIDDTRTFDIPVISIVTDPDNLWNDTIGIYCQGTNGVSGNGVSHPVNFNRDWRRPCNVEIFNNPHDQDINQQCDLSIGGGYSRAYPEKSLELNAEKKYEGENSFDVRLFAKKPYYRFKSLNLRNSGNDFYGSMFRDAMQQTLYAGYVDVDNLAYQPAIHYINGEYYGILNIRERSNHHHVASNWGYDKEDLDFVYTPDSKYMGDKNALNELVALVTAGDYSIAQYEKIRKLLDVDEYINYVLIQSFSANTDWMSNNVKFYRYRNNGLFRWILFDLDHGFSSTSYNQFTATDRSGLSNKSAYTGQIFQGLKDNPHFREKFLDHATAIIGGLIREERYSAIIDSMGALITGEMVYHNKRWGQNNSISSYCNTYKSFAKKRREIYSSQLASYFSLGDPVAVTIEPTTHTSLFINGVEVPTGKFDGYIHKERKYTLSVEVPYGYKFKEWVVTPQLIESSNDTNGTNGINRKKDYTKTTLEFTANDKNYKFVPTFIRIDTINDHVVPAIRINELGANKEITYNDYFDKSDWVELYNRTDSVVDIAGMYISNKDNNPRMYKIPGNLYGKTKIAPHGFCILWADEEPDNRELHLPFKLSANGGRLILSAYDESDSILLWREKIEFTPHNDDQSFGRYPNGSDKLYLLRCPTPASTNLYTSFNMFVMNDTVASYDPQFTVTGIDDTKESDTTIIDVKYYSLSGKFAGNNLNDLQKGVYIRRATYDNNHVKAEKIIKK